MSLSTLNSFEIPHLTTLIRCLSGFPEIERFYLVGGAIRDLLLGRVPVDFDFTSAGDPTSLARTFADQCGGHWFWLDEQRRQSRVIVAGCSYDFAPWRAPSLAADLSARDFTINAMAVELTNFQKDQKLIDPLGGRKDLSVKILRCAGPDVLQDDPLRVLKGIRHAAELDLAIESGTLQALKSAAAKLPACAPERLRAETWRILAAPAVRQGLDLLIECEAGEPLLGKEFCSGIAVVQQVMQRMTALFAALAEGSPKVASWLQEPVEQGLDRRTLLYWSNAFAVINAELPLMTAHRWRFSRTALFRVAALRALAPHLWQELMNLPLRPRPIALWALQHGPDPIDLLLTLGALQPGRSDTVCKQLAPMLELIAELPDLKRVPPLVASNWLKSALGVEGVELGVIHAELRLAEIGGVVSNADDARQYLAHRHPEKC